MHVGPENLARPLFAAILAPVEVGANLPPGQAKPVRLLGEDFTLYRGEGGKAHAVAFRCAHRGTRLSVGWVEEDCIRCMYHGWKYDAAGQCVEQPAEDPPFTRKIKIRSYPIEDIWDHFRLSR